MKLLKSSVYNRAVGASKGQTSFELIIVIAIVFLLSTVIMLDFLTQSKDTLVLAGVKQEATHQLSIANIRVPCHSYLKSISFSKTDTENLISLEVVEQTRTIDGAQYQCAVDIVEIANKVEEQICSTDSNSDEIIQCGGDDYQLSLV